MSSRQQSFARAPERSRAGLTLIELLVAMGVLGVLLAALISLMSGLLGFTRQASAINQGFSDVNDALGYLTMRVRGAVAVYDGLAVDFPGEATPFTCSSTGITPCFAVLVPIVDRGDGSIDDFEVVAYRVLNVGDWDPTFPEGWSGASTPVLVEYRTAGLCGCDEPPEDVGIPVFGDPVLVVADLAPGLVPFTVRADERLVTLQLQMRSVNRANIVDSPRDGPLVSEVRTLR